MPEIDRSAGTAPWKQIAAALRDGIARGAYPPGAPLPSVARIVQDWGVARRTANKALMALAAEGLARKEQGLGYFVIGRQRGHSLYAKTVAWNVPCRTLSIYHQSVTTIAIGYAVASRR